jgi:hypothetical protein
MLYSVHIWRHRRPWNCLNSLLLLKTLYNSGSMWPSVVVHEHWPVGQRMIVEMGDYALSEHIVTVFLACQITIKNVQSKEKQHQTVTPPPPKTVVPKMWFS